MNSFGFLKIVMTARRLGVQMRVFAFLAVLNCIGTCFEIAAVGMLLPVFELLRQGGSAAAGIEKLHGRHWEIMRSISEEAGIPISLGLLLTLSFALIVMRQVFNYFGIRYSGAVVRDLTNKIRRRAVHRFLLAQTALQDQSRVGDVVALLDADLRRALDVLLSITGFFFFFFFVFFFWGVVFAVALDGRGIGNDCCCHCSSVAEVRC